MKAIIWTKYGSPDGLQLQDVPQPAPAANQVLIKVHAATAATPDSEFRRLKLPLLYAVLLRLYFGVIRPSRVRILGTEFAGEVESIGRDVTLYKPGDQVYGYTGLAMGTYAEYMCLSEQASELAGVMAKKPANLSYAEAAAVPFGGLEALHALGRIDLRPGQTMLIVGAGGTIGTWTLQLAKHRGAEVTGVDKPGKLDMLRSIGADHVIDYTREDFTRSGRTYDIILDTISGSRFWPTLRSLNEDGVYLNANPGMLAAIRWRWASKRSGKKVLRWSGGYSTENLLALKELIEAGVLRSVIDRSYPLEQAAEAHRYVDSGDKQGNVVITMAHDHKS